MSGSNDNTPSKNRFLKEALAFIVLSTCIIGSGLGIIYYLHTTDAFVHEKPKNLTKPEQFIAQPMDSSTNLAETTSDTTINTDEAIPIESPPSTLSTNVVALLSGTKKTSKKSKTSKTNTKTGAYALGFASTSQTTSDQEELEVGTDLEVENTGDASKQETEASYIELFKEFITTEEEINSDLKAYFPKSIPDVNKKQTYSNLKTVSEHFNLLRENIMSTNPPEKYSRMHSLFIEELSEMNLFVNYLMDAVLSDNMELIYTAKEHHDKSAELRLQMIDELE